MAELMLATDADICGFSWLVGAGSRGMSRLGRAEESRDAEPLSLTKPMTPLRSMATKLLRTLLSGLGEPLRASGVRENELADGTFLVSVCVAWHAAAVALLGESSLQLSQPSGTNSYRSSSGASALDNNKQAS